MYAPNGEKGWQFLRTILDNAEMSLLKADMVIAEQYSQALSKPENQVLANQFFGTIKTEYERTKELVLKVTGHSRLFDGQRYIQESIERRNPNVDPLNFIQIEALSRIYEILDPLEMTPLEMAPPTLQRQLDPLYDVVALTINGIAAALRNTG